MKRARHQHGTSLLVGLVLCLSASVGVAVPNQPLHWAGNSFSRHGEAVEHVTIRGQSKAGHSTFIRFALANAAFKSGALTITFKQETKKGTLYAKKTYKRGAYKVFTNRFGLQAGGNRLEIAEGHLTMVFDLGSVRGMATVVSKAKAQTVRDRDNSGWIQRRLLIPRGKYYVEAANAAGLTAKLEGTVFAVHEASTVKAHRSYSRSVQLHHTRRGHVYLVDYIVGPKERNHRPLGFVVLLGGKHHYVGPVTAERRTVERIDRHNNYRVPYHILVDSKAGARAARVILKAKRRVSRRDDLANLGFFARKAVGFLIHPYTYLLAGEVTISSNRDDGKPKRERIFTARYKYAQAR